ncbi:hypothetical protein F1D05_22635 [Kribbella qitaiheensis]|uniref:Uncharacterized protein n=1 Tax=Kribbella qitaiheensis TaxID=1544730 RepID=A0A7G6X1S9_9ACTN|nr:hypothetical protein [Kribbella qitaiheensis]QNE20194.1 hypothetical protein F1D05_22635 [Kribbella qitaiheensis]
MTALSISAPVPTFSLCEIANLIGALTSIQPAVLAAMPEWTTHYREAVTKALELVSVSSLDEVNLTYIYVNEFRVSTQTACNCEGH